MWRRSVASNALPPACAAADDVSAAQDELRGEIGALKSQLQQVLPVCLSKVQAMHEMFDSICRATKAAEARAEETSQRIATDAKLYTDQSSTSLYKEVASLFVDFGDKLNASVSASEADLKRTLADELEAFSRRFEKELAELREHAEQQAGARAQAPSAAAGEEAAARDHRFQEEIDSMRHELRQQGGLERAAEGASDAAKLYTDLCVGDLRGEVSPLLGEIQDLGRRVTAADTRTTHATDAFTALFGRFEHEMAKLPDYVSAYAEQHFGRDAARHAPGAPPDDAPGQPAPPAADAHRDDRREEGCEELARVSDQKQRKLVESLFESGGIVDQLRDFHGEAERRIAALEREATKLRAGLSDVANMSTRRVEWVITRASRFVQPLSRPEGRSTDAHMSWFSSSFDAAGVHGFQFQLQVYQSTEPAMDGGESGDCAVFLWACTGLNMVYRLSVGDSSQVLESRFSGHEPHGTGRLCFLRDHINKNDDTLHIGLEILEIVWEFRRAAQPSPPQMPAIGDGAAPDSGSTGPCDCEEGAGAPQPPSGLLIFHRHVNNRLLEQVRKQVEHMKSRMVRRVEWRVEQAAVLRHSFPHGEPVRSREFDAAGIEGLQLIFYPSGYTGATKGFCSLFLLAPAGATLKFWLHVGKERREATHSFDESGAYGRTNFCRLDSCIDEAQDVVVVALDVQDAYQDLAETSAHSPAQAGDRHPAGAADASRVSAVKSVLKLHRAPGRMPQCLEDVKLLPSLWMAKEGHPGGRPSGVHPLREYNSRIPALSNHADGAREGAPEKEKEGSGQKPRARSGSLGGAHAARARATGGKSGPARRCESTPFLDGCPVDCVGDDLMQQAIIRRPTSALPAGGRRTRLPRAGL